MGNLQICGNPCQEQHQEIVFQYPSLETIRVNLQKYGNENGIGAFSAFQQNLISSLFTLGQVHVSDRLIFLIKNRRNEEKQRMINDLCGIDLEEFDELCFLSTKSISKEKISKFYQVLKIDDQFKREGELCLRKKKYAFIVTVRCFNDFDSTAESNLLSRRSKLQTFIGKLSALHSQYETDFIVFMLSPKQSVKQLASLTSHHKYIEILPYSSTYPCFNSSGKIILYGNTILFNEKSGDLIQFITHNEYLSKVIPKYDYIIFSDLNNLKEPAINPSHLGWLDHFQDKYFLAAIKSMSNSLPITNGFIDFQSQDEVGNIILKVDFLQSISHKLTNYYQIFTKRIKKMKIDTYQDSYCFSRMPKDMLYENFSAVVQVSSCASDRVEYSNYCKSVLGIVNESEEDIVDICPEILFGRPERLEEVVRKLQDSSEISGFPIVILKINDNDYI